MSLIRGRANLWLERKPPAVTAVNWTVSKLCRWCCYVYIYIHAYICIYVCIYIYTYCLPVGPHTSKHPTATASYMLKSCGETWNRKATASKIHRCSRDCWRPGDIAAQGGSGGRDTTWSALDLQWGADDLMKPKESKSNIQQFINSSSIVPRNLHDFTQQLDPKNHFPGSRRPDGCGNCVCPMSWSLRLLSIDHQSASIVHH